MNRRMVLAMAGIPLSTALSGCLGSMYDSSPDEKAQPSHPEELTADSVISFVEEYEEVEQHNRLLSENTTELNVWCKAALDIEYENRYYVLTRCWGSDKIEREPGSVSVGEIDTYLTLYEVTTDELYRADRLPDSPSEITHGTGVRVVNFDQEEKGVEITVTTGNGSGEESLFNEYVPLGAASFYELPGIVLETDTYQLTVELDDGTIEQYEWNVTSITPYFDLNVYVIPKGNIKFGTHGETPTQTS